MLEDKRDTMWIHRLSDPKNPLNSLTPQQFVERIKEVEKAALEYWEDNICEFILEWIDSACNEQRFIDVDAALKLISESNCSDQTVVSAHGYTYMMRDRLPNRSLLQARCDELNRLFNEGKIK